MKPRKRSRTAISKECDQLVSVIVRARGWCELKVLAPEIACAGNFQCCHIVGRRHRSTRWDLDNLLCGCAAHHMHFTHRPEAFFLALEETWPGLFGMLWDRALKTWDKDLNGTLERLRVMEDD